MSGAWRGLERLVQDFDEVAWEESDGSRIAAQSPHPPQTIASVERFDQVAFYKA